MEKEHQLLENTIWKKNINFLKTPHGKRTSTSSKHHMEKKHRLLQNKDFVILGDGFRNNTVKRKIFEALWIKDLRPTLNKQEKSIELKLFMKVCLKSTLQWSFVLYRNQSFLLQCKSFVWFLCYRIFHSEYSLNRF